MKKINKFGYIIMGMIIAIIIGVVTPVSATTQYVTKQLTAYFLPEDKHVTIYANDKKINEDANGNKIMPFIIDGTMYLPIKTVADVLGKEVKWYEDSATITFNNIYTKAPGNIKNDKAKLTTAIDNNGERHDKLDYEFILDENAVGEWKMFHYYSDLSDFAPAIIPEQHFNWTGYSIYTDGKGIMHYDFDEVTDDEFNWTKGYFEKPLRMTGSPAYSINTIGDRTFMFLEYKNGDYLRTGAMSYYVFMKVSDTPAPKTTK